MQGIYDLQAAYEAEYGPGNYIPPVAVSYWTFRIMVGAGLVMALLLVSPQYDATIEISPYRDVDMQGGDR